MTFRIPKGAMRIPKGAMRKHCHEQVHTRQRLTLAPTGADCLPTFSTLSTGGEAPRWSLSLSTGGASRTQPPAHPAHEDDGPRIIRPRLLEEAPQRRELAGVRGQAQQGEHVGELFGGHAYTVAHPCHLGVTPRTTRARPSCCAVRARVRARARGNAFTGADSVLTGTLKTRANRVAHRIAPDGKAVVFPRDFDKARGMHGR